MKKLLATVLVAFTLVACTATPESGYITGKRHHAAWMQMICTSYDKNGICTMQTPVFYPESWCLELRADNGDTGCHGVDEETYDRYEVGQHYPDPR